MVQATLSGDARLSFAAHAALAAWCRKSNTGASNTSKSRSTTVGTRKTLPCLRCGCYGWPEGGASALTRGRMMMSALGAHLADRVFVIISVSPTSCH